MIIKAVRFIDLDDLVGQRVVIVPNSRTITYGISGTLTITPDGDCMVKTPRLPSSFASILFKPGRIESVELRNNKIPLIYLKYDSAETRG